MDGRARASRRFIVAAVLASLVVGVASAAANSSISVSGFPSKIGTQQRFPITVSGFADGTEARGSHQVFSVAVTAYGAAYRKVYRGACPERALSDATQGDLQSGAELYVKLFFPPGAFSFTPKIKFPQASSPWTVCAGLAPEPPFPEGFASIQNVATVDVTNKRQPVSTIGGRVIRACFGAPTCPLNNGFPGVKLLAKGKAGRGSATTGKDGRWSMLVHRGTYVVTPSRKNTKFAPKTRKVVATSNRGNVDFQACGPLPATASAFAPFAVSAAATPGTYTHKGTVDDNGCGGQIFTATIDAAGTLTVRWDAHMFNSGDFHPITATVNFVVKNAALDTDIVVSDDGSGSGTNTSGKLVVQIPSNPPARVLIKTAVGSTKGQKGFYQERFNGTPPVPDSAVLALYPGGVAPGTP